MIRKRKGFAILLAAVFSLGMLGGVPAYAEGIPEETIQQDTIGIHQNDVDQTDIPKYVEGEAIVCYKAEVSETDEIGKDDIPVIDQEEEESLKQEAEETLEAERCVDEAEALLLVGDVGEQIISEEETEDREALPGVITLVQSDHLTTEELIAELSERDDVLYAEPNYIQTVQSDDLTDRQWGETSTYGIGVERWNSYSGDAPAPEVNTSGLVVAVLDTGVDYTHEDLRDVMWDDGLDYPELVKMGGGAYGYNSAVMRSDGRLYDTTDPMDDHHHGTHCAGIIAASWNGMGVSGVTSGAKIMAIKVGNEKGSMMGDAIIRGFQYVIAAKKAGVNIVASNHSYGGTADSITEAVLVEEAGRCGIVCVYAAGNNKQNIDLSNNVALFLGKKKNALIVGASTSEGEKASFSDYGRREVDVFAPGYEIWSTYPMKTGTPTEESKTLTLGERSLFIDYSSRDSVEDEIFGFSGVNCSLKIRTCSDERNTLCAELDESGLNIALLTKEFEDLTDCFGGVIGVYAEQKGSLGFSVYEMDSEGRTEWIGNGSGDLTPGLNQIGFLYPKKANLKRKNVRLRIAFGRKDSEGNVVPQLDIRQFRLTSDGGNYDVESGTSMAAPMVTGGVAVLRAKYPDDSVEKLCARVTGSVLTLDSLSDYCLSGGIFRLDKAVAGETVPVPQSAYIEGKTLVVEGFFFGTSQGTLKVDGKECTVKTWSGEKITANLPMGYKEGENRIEVTSGTRAGHGFFRLGTPKNLYSRLLLPGSTLSGEGEYQISESAREKYADFYKGTPTSMYTLSDSLYVFVQKLNGGTAVFRYKISEEQWDEVCVSDVCEVSSGITAWNGRIYLTGTDAKNNKNYIGCFDPEKNELKWTLTGEGYAEDGVRLVNNGYGIYLMGGSRGTYGVPPQEREKIYSLRRLDPEKMELRVLAEDVGANFGEYPLVSALEDGTIIVVSGFEISSAEEIRCWMVSFNGDAPKELNAVDVDGLFSDMTLNLSNSIGGVATSNGLLLFGTIKVDENGLVVKDSCLLPYGGGKITPQSKILGYRPTHHIITAAHDGICYVLGMNVEEDNSDLFCGIQAETLESYGTKAYSEEWVDGIWYGKNGFRTLSHPNKAKWNENKKGRWYEDSSGWYPKNCWQKIDGEWYYFDSDGYVETDSFRKGWYLTKDGTYDGKGAAEWKQNVKGWWYELPDGSYLKNTWKKIDGKWYYFKADGYAAQNEWVKGYYWLGSNCAWNYLPKGTWHKTAKGWWFGDTSGWYAKGAAYTIGGKKYTFDKAGYCLNP